MGKSLGVCEQVFLLTLYPAIFVFFFPLRVCLCLRWAGFDFAFVHCCCFVRVGRRIGCAVHTKRDRHKPTQTHGDRIRVPVGLPERSAGLEKAEEEGRHSQNKQSNTTAAPPQRCSSSALIYPHPPPHNLRLGTKVRHRVHRPTVVVNISWLPRPTSKELGSLCSILHPPIQR